MRHHGPTEDHLTLETTTNLKRNNKMTLQGTKEADRRGLSAKT
jgi:hypothetical protein